MTAACGVPICEPAPGAVESASRGDHGEVISERMSRWTAERTTEQALAEMEKVQIPAGPLYSPQQALEDAHIRAAGLLVDTEYPEKLSTSQQPRSLKPTTTFEPYADTVVSF